ncbi:hypothetical protein ASF61_12675 [Duganella sp. Leaf126]|uniref:cell envelope integrity protein TolA n=1 Tax=Duganella sp. Leaf126 TaxID=1736266 RepID=UPI000700D054|nr:cell envelope integrity protein TolA [Duganella sp. Leaf126]KQQ32942.1 hypothetical protein ASF61_12675 [Duganella sp. Leaf126]
MFPDDPRRHGDAVRAHVGRHRFLYLSLALHALPLAALGYFGYTGKLRVEAAQRERLVESGMQQTEQARLEKRVQAMAQIKSLLEQSTGGKHPAPSDPRQHEGQILPGAQQTGTNTLMAQARALSRTIETIEQDIKAEELAKLLQLSKEKAVARLAEMRKPAQPETEPTTRAEAAEKIAQLEAKARQVLAQRRQQLERRRDGIAVTAAASPKRDHGRPAAAAAGQEAGVAGDGGGGGAPAPTTLERIAAFTNPDLPDRQTTEYKAGGIFNYVDRGIGHIPAVDAQHTVNGTGRIIGAGGEYGNRIYVNAWYLIGPFQGKRLGELFSNYRYPPDDAVVLDAVYRGKGNRLLKWEYVNLATYPLIPSDEAENAVYYGYTEVMLDEERDMTIWVGADDDAQLWINDKLAWKGGNYRKQWFFDEIYETKNTYVADYNLSEGKRVVRFRKGRNQLLFKLSNGPTRLFFSLVLTSAS